MAQLDPIYVNVDI